MKFENVEIIEIEEGHTISIKSKELRQGVTLKVYNDTDAELIIEGRETVEVPFKWTERARELIETLADDLHELVSGKSFVWFSNE